MTDMTSEQYRKLADLCDPTAENIRTIAEVFRTVASPDELAEGLPDIHDMTQWLGYSAKGRFLDQQASLARSEDAERQLREDIMDLMKVDPAGRIDAIIRRVREAGKG